VRLPAGHVARRVTDDDDVAAGKGASGLFLGAAGGHGDEPVAVSVVAAEGAGRGVENVRQPRAAELEMGRAFEIAGKQAQQQVLVLRESAEEMRRAGECFDALLGDGDGQPFGVAVEHALGEGVEVGPAVVGKAVFFQQVADDLRVGLSGKREPARVDGGAGHVAEGVLDGFASGAEGVHEGTVDVEKQERHRCEECTEKDRGENRRRKRAVRSRVVWTVIRR